jgi:predicted amidophosphoribosyltransferase
MENLDKQPKTTPLTEMAFRRAAGLCQHCGMARRLPGSLLCENCGEEAMIQEMQAQWKAWGIAA